MKPPLVSRWFTQILNLVAIQLPLLILEPLLMLLLPLCLFGLHFKILVQSLKSLLLEVDFSFGSDIAQLFVLFKLILIEICVFRDR